MRGPDKLCVIWSQPPANRRCVIGHLWRDEQGVAFAYDPEGVKLAQDKGFTALTEFPVLREESSPYRAGHLFNTFAQRIPSTSRPDYRSMMDAWGVEGDDPFEALARSGGVQLTDRLELAEYRTADDDLSRPLYFRVAGGQHFTGEGTAVQPGHEVSFRRQPTNEYDPSATEVVAITNGVQIGWVPRQYSQLIAKHIDSGQVPHAVVVRRLTIPPERGRWVVKVSKR